MQTFGLNMRFTKRRMRIKGDQLVESRKAMN